MTDGVDFEEAGEKWRGGDAAKVRKRMTWNEIHIQMLTFTVHPLLRSSH
jgi:hypothetical protein